MGQVTPGSGPRNVALLLWAAEPGAAHRCATPFAVAAAAAAMDAEVEIYFAAGSVRLLAASVAENLFPSEGRERSVADFMRDARGQGVRFFACAASLAAVGMTLDECRPWVEAGVGASSVAVRALDPAWSVLVF